MAYCDFIVRYDETKDSIEDLTERILYSIFIKRLRHKKPCVIFLCGDSGEGKSWGALKLEYILLKLQGIDLLEVLKDVNVYIPIEYPEKLDNLLFEKRLKKIRWICVHEARELVKSKNWQSFLTQAIADVNALSRSIKRLGFIIISQFIRDITPDIRYTLNFYIKSSRPRGKLARLYINILWKDDRDLEKPRLRKRRLSGYLVDPNGKRRRFIPKYLEVEAPSKEITEAFEKADYEAKSSIIKRKLTQLMREMKLDIGETTNKVTTLVEWYKEHPESLNSIGKRLKDKFVIKKEVRELHNMKKEESDQFQKLLYQALEEKGIIETVNAKKEENP